MSKPVEYSVDYNKIAARPTTYCGVDFRSRLEAQWAAFFDLCGWGWQYEPLILNGWLPDFRIRTSACDLFAEVKPIDLAQAWSDHLAGKTVSIAPYDKARQYGDKIPIILLGLEPTCLYGDDIIGVVTIEIDRALAIAGCTLEELNNSLRVEGHAGSKWQEARDKMMGLPPRKHIIFPDL